jgi:hypothetical protein
MDAFAICIAVVVVALLGFAHNRRMERRMDEISRRAVYEAEEKIYWKAREEASKAAYAAIQGTLQEAENKFGVMTRRTTAFLEDMKNSIREFNLQRTEIHNQQGALQQMQRNTEATLKGIPTLLAGASVVNEAQGVIDKLQEVLFPWVKGIAKNQANKVVEDRVSYRYRNSSGPVWNSAM